jgi:hypothetical protein
LTIFFCNEGLGDSRNDGPGAVDDAGEDDLENREDSDALNDRADKDVSELWIPVEAVKGLKSISKRSEKSNATAGDGDSLERQHGGDSLEWQHDSLARLHQDKSLLHSVGAFLQLIQSFPQLGKTVDDIYKVGAFDARILPDFFYFLFFCRFFCVAKPTSPSMAESL